MTSCRQQALKHSLPFPPAPGSSRSLLVWGLHFLSCHIAAYWPLPRTVIHLKYFATPPSAIFLSVRGTEPILSYNVPSLENLLPSLCPFLLCTVCSLRRTLHCREAWPPPTPLLPLVCLTLLVSLWGKNLRRLQRTTWNNDTEWWEGMLASFLWGKVCLN